MRHQYQYLKWHVSKSYLSTWRINISLVTTREDAGACSDLPVNPWKMTLVSFPIFRLDIVSSYDFLCIEVPKDAEPVLHEKWYNGRPPWIRRIILPTNGDCISISTNDNEKYLYERRKEKK
jgi:hypothetical protein